MLLELIHNVALLVVLSVGLQMLARHFQARAIRYRLAAGLLFGAVGIVGMMTPLEFAPGVIYDARSIVLALSGLFGGPLAAGLATAMCGAYRFHIGGTGLLPGLGVIAEAAAMGVVLYYLRHRDERWVRPLPLLAFGLLIHVGMLGLQLLLPADARWEVLRAISPSVLVLYPLGFLLAAQVFLEGERVQRDERALRESEGRYRSLFENNHAVMLIIDPDKGAVVDANPAACSYYGWTRNDLMGKPISEIDTVPPEALEKELERARTARRNHFYFQHRLASGTVRDVEVFSGPIQLEGRQLLYSIVHDITARKRAEAALEDSRRQLSTLMDNLPGMAYQCDFDAAWTMRFVSQGAVSLTGYEPNDLRNNARVSYHEVIHPEDRDHVAETVQHAVAAAQPFELEYRIYTRDGVEKLVWERGRAVEDGGQGGLCIEGFVMDVTERRLSENRIEHLNRVLRAIRDVNQLIVREQDQDALIQEACRLLVQHRGYTTALIILTDEKDWPISWAHAGFGHGVTELDEQLSAGHLPPCCLEVHGRNGPILISDREPYDAACPLSLGVKGTETLCVRLVYEGTPYGHLAVSLAPHHGADEEEQALFAEIASDLVYALNTMADRKARLQAEQDREEMQQRLLQAQKMEAVGQLAGGVAHDFNNILQAVMGYTQMLLETAPKEGELREGLEEIYRGADRAATLTRQLLMFSRRQIMNPKPLDLNEVIENLLDMLQRIIGEHIKLQWEPGPGLKHLYADVGMIEQIVVNLCVNARDAMPQGGYLTIQTREALPDEHDDQGLPMLKPGEHVVLIVSDTGTGMDRETLEHIFEPFFTTKPKERGTGLGLATVYGIVKQHEGVITADSTLGEGAVFKVYLPVDNSAAVPEPPPAEVQSAGGPETILLAEDDGMVRRLGVRTLERAGYRVLAARDGEEAVALFEQQPAAIALLVFDVVMPNMGGYDAYLRIREHKDGVRVLFTSGYNESALHTNFFLDKRLKLLQ